MKAFLKETFDTTEIEQVNLDDLKMHIEGSPFLTRIKYRKQVGMGV
jgi:hypothetical protein